MTARGWHGATAALVLLASALAVADPVAAAIIGPASAPPAPPPMPAALSWATAATRPLGADCGRIGAPCCANASQRFCGPAQGACLVYDGQIGGVCTNYGGAFVRTVDPAGRQTACEQPNRFPNVTVREPYARPPSPAAAVL